jgi:hypothetical protein
VTPSIPERVEGRRAASLDDSVAEIRPQGADLDHRFPRKKPTTNCRATAPRWLRPHHRCGAGCRRGSGRPEGKGATKSRPTCMSRLRARVSEGDTPEEAQANIREAIELYLEPAEDDRVASEDSLVQGLVLREGSGSPHALSLSSHSHHRSSGCGSGGAMRHRTSTLSSISLAKLTNSPLCISLQENSPLPILTRAA